MVYGLFRADALEACGDSARRADARPAAARRVVVAGRVPAGPGALWHRRVRERVADSPLQRGPELFPGGQTSALPWWLAHARVLGRTKGVGVAAAYAGSSPRSTSHVAFTMPSIASPHDARPRRRRRLLPHARAFAPVPALARAPHRGESASDRRRQRVRRRQRRPGRRRVSRRRPRRGAGNLGFAAGANAGIARGDAPYVLILNPDTGSRRRPSTHCWR